MMLFGFCLINEWISSSHAYRSLSKANGGLDRLSLDNHSSYGKVQIRIQYTGAGMFQIIFEILVQIS